MKNVMKTIYYQRLTNEFDSEFPDGHRLRKTPEEGQIDNGWNYDNKYNTSLNPKRNNKINFIFYF